MTTAQTTINASFKHPLAEEELARLVRNSQFPEKYREHILVFFTEVSNSVIWKFMKANKLSMVDLKSYYYKHVKRCYTNKYLEEMFQIE